MKKINFLRGLPCSGKSTYLSTLTNVEIIDDPTNFSDLVNQIQNSKFDIIWIADPHLCDSKIFELAKQKISDIFTNFIFEEFCFENNLEKCLKNLERRVKNGDLRKVKSFLIQMSKIYSTKNSKNILKIND